MHILTFLTLEEIVAIHNDQIQKFGGIAGIRDSNLLKSALYDPQAQFGNSYLHKDIFHMAAAYAYGIIKNHPFLDGNKRTGIIAPLLFLMNNNQRIIISQDELYDLAITIAQSKISKENIAQFLQQNCHTITKL